MSLDYTLSPLPGNRTQLILKGRRRAYGVGAKNPPKSQWETSVAKSWRHFARVLESDYKRTSTKGLRK